MSSVDTKSIGDLIDELITSSFKIQAGIAGSQERYDVLAEVINRRAIDIGLPPPRAIIDVLQQTSRLCWEAQDIIMDDQADVVGVAEAARLAQRMNAKRNKLIRQIDEYFGEDDITQLEKTYSKSEA